MEPGRHRVMLWRVELACVGTSERTTPATARSLYWFQFTPMGSVGAVYTCNAARFIVYSLAGTRTVFHILCCVDVAAAATSLAGIVV